MTLEKLTKLIKEIEGIFQEIKYKGLTNFCEVKTVFFAKDYGLDIWVKLPIKDRDTGEDTSIYTHYMYGPSELKYLEASNIVRRIKTMIIYLETHEVEENLLYQGMRVFDPHTQVLMGPLVEKQKRKQQKKTSKMKKELIDILNAHAGEEIG